ncbi:MAG: FtsX-like permease family protein [Prolixibacteraceae bacterium]|nr:FtsX-like permease family protein [Prolixibacteraceae bacterium]
MIKFLFQGLMRDKSRSRMPIIIVAIGVMLSVFLHAYINGMLNDSVEVNARLSLGHVKVITKAYSDNISQMPTDLAIVGTESLTSELKKTFPDVTWVERIQFGGLIDMPDDKGETVTQGSAMGFGIDMLSGNSEELDRMNISKSLVRGQIPSKSNEILISELFSQKLGVNPGDEVTLIGSTMNGAMSYYNFIVSGTVSFGIQIMDKGCIVADINDVRKALDMEDAATEINGYLKSGFYTDNEANEIKDKFKSIFPEESEDDYAPVMLTLKSQGLIGQMIDISSFMGMIVTSVFLIAMSLVLWNGGLLGGIRRYGEFGVRLAMGEEKKHVYITLIYESVIIGIIGSIIGTFLGLLAAWYFQEYGINLGDTIKGSSVMIPNVFKAHITPADYYIGFIPGLISTVIGSALAGIGIYKRKTSQLFKELEA